MELLIEEVNTANKDEWEGYVETREDASYVDYFNWRNAVEETYGLKHYWYVAKTDYEIRGVLGLTFTKHPVFGSYLATAPFGSRGGFYAETIPVRDALLSKAERLKQELNADYVLIRHLDKGEKPPADWRQSPVYISSRINTKTDACTILFDKLKSDSRNQIKKSLKKEYSYVFGSMEELFEDAWYVLIRSMKNLGSPYHSKKFLKMLCTLFGDAAKLGVVYCQNKNPLAALFCIRHNRTLSPVHAGILQREKHPYAGVFLYWSTIDICCTGDIDWLDLGRSLMNSPQAHFKNKFSPINESMGYWYYLPENRPVPNLNQSNPKYDIPRKLWTLMPLGLQTYIGPWLIKGVL